MKIGTDDLLFAALAFGIVLVVLAGGETLLNSTLVPAG